MSTTMQVKIGPSFFKKTFNDYSDWHFAWVRELMQNSVDARATQIDVSVNLVDGNTTVIWTNDGRPMDQEELCDKLLALGESGKDFQGTIGGFGAAKLLIMFCHDSWQVRTGTLMASGSGGEYELNTDLPMVHGTITTVVMKGDQVRTLERKLRYLAEYSSWRGTLTLNGQETKTNLRRGSFRRELSCGKLYTNRHAENKLVVRIGGIPMGIHWIDFDRCVILDLTHSQFLTSNRDGLRHPYSDEVEGFVQDVAVNKRSALRDTSPTYTYYAGFKVRARRKSNERRLEGVIPSTPVLEAVMPFLDHIQKGAIHDLLGPSSQIVEPVHKCDIPQAPEPAPPAEPGVEAPEAEANEASEGSAPAPYVPTEWARHYTAVKTSRIGHDFIIRNAVGMKIPRHYEPSTPSSYTCSLTRAWVGCLVELFDLFGVEEEFSVGFVFEDADEDTGYRPAAMYDQSEDYGHLFLINPADVVKGATNARSLAKSWRVSADKDKMIATAVHEFVHYQGFKTHDEMFAIALTKAMTKVLQNRKRFLSHFRA